MIRRALALALAVWLLPVPASAHAVGPGTGVELELLLVAGAVVFFGVRLRASGTAKPWAPWAILAIGLGLGALSFVLPQLTTTSRNPGNISIQIVSPESGQTVPAGRPLEVRMRVSGAEVARSPSDGDRGHIHIYVDDELQQMPYSTSTEITLSPGTHGIVVEYVDALHAPYDPRVRTSVRVRATEE